MRLTQGTSPGLFSAKPRRFHFWLILVLALTLLSMFVGFNARKVHQVWAEWRCARVSTQVSILLEQDDAEGAFTLAGEAIRKYPDNADMLRVVARLVSEISNDWTTAMALLNRLRQLGRASETDLLDLAYAQAQVGDLVSTQATLKFLPKAAWDSRKAMEARAVLARHSGDTAAADALLRAAYNADPNDRMAQLMLAKMDQDEAMQSGRTSVLRRIWDIAREQDKAAKEALFYLAKSELISSNDVLVLMDLMEAHPFTDDLLRYTVLHAHHRVRPLDTSTLVKQELRRNQGRPASELGEFFIWLGRVGHHRQVLELLPPSTAKGDAKSLLILVDALAAAKEWQPLLELMNQPDLPVSDATRSLVLAQCHGFSPKKDLSAASQLLQNLILKATRNEKDTLQRAVVTAETLGFTSVAREAVERLLELKAPNRLPLLETLLELARRDHDVGGMMDALLELTRMRPGHSRYSDQLLYLRLLSGEGMEVAAEALQQTESNVPQSGEMPRAILRAIAAKRFGETERWKSAMAEVKAPGRLSAGLRALLAGYYAEIGEHTESFRLVESLVGDGQSRGDKTNLLLPAERRELEKAMR